MNTQLLIDWGEMIEYLPGTTVELISKPGVLQQIDCYEPIMVPPVWLVDDPRPHYPHELRVVSRQNIKACDLDHKFLWQRFPDLVASY